MSAVRTKEVLLSPDEYIAGELLSEVRHEYLAGRAYAMALDTLYARTGL